MAEAPVKKDKKKELKADEDLVSPGLCRASKTAS